MPNTGISSGGVFHASRLRWNCLRTSRSASCAPLRSNLLIATKSAKSSMSIFSSWLAAPNSGVITYSDTSTSGTIAASPWPMPDVSTMTRSKPATLHAAITSGSALRDLAAGVARRERAHVDVRMLDRVHPDAVAEQRAAGLAPRRVDRDDRDLQRVVLVEAEAADQLVGQRALAGAAGAGDAERRDRRLLRGGVQLRRAASPARCRPRAP